MRLLPVIMGVFAAVVCIENPAEAQNYPWCAYYNDQEGGFTNCGFVTFQQCLAALSGVGGSCGANPQYQGSPGLYLSTKHPRRPFLLSDYGSCKSSRQLGDILRDPSGAGSPRPSQQLRGADPPACGS